MSAPSPRDEGLTAAIGTMLVVIIIVLIAGVAFVMFQRLTEEKLDQDTAYVAFSPNANERNAVVADAEPELTWGVDLLVSGTCGASLNGGAISGPVLSGDVLQCSGPGTLIVRSSEGKGNALLLNEEFE